MEPLSQVVLHSPERALSSTSLESHERVVSHGLSFQSSRILQVSDLTNIHLGIILDGQILEDWNYLFQFTDRVQEQRIGQDSRPKSSLEMMSQLLEYFMSNLVFLSNF